MKPMNLGRARNLQRPEGVDTSSASSENDTLIGTTFTYTPGENARHYSDTMGIDIVTLNVGNKLFRVHKKKLCNAIPYFNKLFNTHNTNGKLENTATFLNDNPDYFDILLEWVYTGSLRTLEFTQTSNGVSFSWAPVEVYTLAHRFWVSQLMDSIMNEWIKCALLNDTLPSITSTAEIYAKAPPNSAPRKYAVCTLFNIICQKRQRSVFEGWPTRDIAELMAKNMELAVDLINVMREHCLMAPVVDPRNMPQCVFHYHGKDEPCSLKE